MVRLAIVDNQIITTGIEDGMTTAIVGIDYGHHEIHNGNSFTAFNTSTTAATDAVRSGLFFKTPVTASGLLHAIISFSASVAATFSICEAPTIAANTGTAHAVHPINRYRDSATTSGILDNATSPAVGHYTTLIEAAFAGDATWATGTVIRTEPLVAGDGPKPAGGSNRDMQEYILKANTKYMFMITNNVATANTHHILVDWYEV